MCVGGRFLERVDCTVLGHDREQRETCMLFGADWWIPVMLRCGNERERYQGSHGLLWRSQNRKAMQEEEPV